ncbi:hypothetical protein MM221_10620 [Salipaludibacillus sp. LMS25]|uniref:hypothetical protein n=1 Tax=Salipaludibacillus sp. LMS25 TaxID=2924031 RepID=UPI0020D05584|nr:hypothetical protein [Salipaludibacillus sp. LMS25]UTR13115.1 hypothetical protein MM221_10620 [Salipaludibacillus sp. LMS25]
MMLHPPRKYNYRMKTYSTLVLSPRDHQGFYKAAGDFIPEDLEKQASEHVNKERVNIIYPFYQYGTYPRYAPAEIQYYIPGSSIKGALPGIGTEKGKPSLMVDDIRVKSEDIQLYHLQKVQNISKEDTPIAVAEFFPNVAVEMLRADSEYSGELFYVVSKSNTKLKHEPELYFREADQATRTKLEQLVQRIKLRFDQVKKEEDQLILSELRKNVQAILNEPQADSSNNFLLILGGYKGLMLSAISIRDDYNSAVYLDKTKRLPHGLVQLTLEHSSV